MFHKIINQFNKLPFSGQILFFIVLFLCIVMIFNHLPPLPNSNTFYSQIGIEGYEQRDGFLFKTGTKEIYDDFYANMYDFLVYNSLKDDYEVGIIINRTSPTTKSVILDVGCGTGHHVAKLAEHGFNVLGIDISEPMILKAKENYPESTTGAKFQVGNALNPTQFMFSTFTHILCMYFTIYYFPDKHIFFSNCMQWLMPGGYLVIHLVERNHFDPILPAGNPLYIVSPQRYAKKRITNTKVKFNDFSYEADFQPNDGDDQYDGISHNKKTSNNNNVAYFNEKITLKNGKTRKHQHVFYMEPEEDILTMAQEVGFIYQAKVDLIKCGYEHQYLYIFTKPE